MQAGPCEPSIALVTFKSHAAEGIAVKSEGESGLRVKRFKRMRIRTTKAEESRDLKSHSLHWTFPLKTGVYLPLSSTRKVQCSCSVEPNTECS